MNALRKFESALLHSSRSSLDNFSRLIQSTMVINAEEKALLFKAAEENDLKTVKYYVEEQLASLLLMNEDQETLVHIAARNGYTDLLKYVLKREPAIVADKDSMGNTAFFLANQVGATDIVKYMYEEHRAEVMKGRGHHFISFALHTAVQFGHLNTVKYFVEEKNCDVNTMNERRESLLYAAVEYGYHDIVKYLVEKRHADTTTLTITRANIIFPTVATKDLPLMKYFFDELKLPIDVNAQDKFGNTLVHRAAFMNRTDIMEYLVDEKHANINIPGDEKMTPLHYAASRNCHKICEFLVERGANLWAIDDAGQIPAQKTFDKILITYMKNVTSATRNRRHVHPILGGYNPQSSLLNGVPLPGGKLEVGAPTLFSNFYSSRLQDFLVIAELIVQRTGRLFGKGNSETFRSPFNILLEKMDPIAVDAVASLRYFEEQ